MSDRWLPSLDALDKAGSVLPSYSAPTPLKRMRDRGAVWVRRQLLTERVVDQQQDVLLIPSETS
jgi:hypothetical protein